MFKYIICEISGKQVKLLPNKLITVALNNDSKEIKAKVLMKADEKGVQVGNPYLKEEVILKVVSSGKGKKVRVGKFHAKANYRRVKGDRAFVSTILLVA